MNLKHQVFLFLLVFFASSDGQEMEGVDIEATSNNAGAINIDTETGATNIDTETGATNIDTERTAGQEAALSQDQAHGMETARAHIPHQGGCPSGLQFELESCESDNCCGADADCSVDQKCCANAAGENRCIAMWRGPGAAAPLDEPGADAVIIEGHYVVVLDTEATVEQTQKVCDNHGIDLDRPPFYIPGSGGSRGFSSFGAMLTEEKLQLVMDLACVKAVYHDAEVTADVVWNLDRIDQQDLPLDNSFSTPNFGTGCASPYLYILDTGIRHSHADFITDSRSRATYVNCFASDCDSTGIDKNGHGTHVAGIAGSNTYGVCKVAEVFNVQVLNAAGKGTLSGVTAGIVAAANHHIDSGRQMVSVGCMSLSAGTSEGIDSAFAGAISAARNEGLVFAVAAGNDVDGHDSCSRQPAYLPTVVTVASSDNRDKLSSFSARGTCVDIIAPGSSVTSTYKDGGTYTQSGTSMSAPHVAGAMAYLSLDWGDRPTGMSWDDAVTTLVDRLMENTVSGKISIKGKLSGSTANKLLQVISVPGETCGGGFGVTCTGSCDDSCNCADGKSCVSGTCIACTCDGKGCGKDECGDDCPDTCVSGQRCLENTCCTPDCTGKQCGPDTCGGDCDSQCTGSQTCNRSAGTCEEPPQGCTPDCTGKQCGPDTCGGDCVSQCTGSQTCNESDGTCEEPPQSSCTRYDGQSFARKRGAFQMEQCGGSTADFATCCDCVRDKGKSQFHLDGQGTCLYVKKGTGQLVSTDGYVAGTVDP